MKITKQKRAEENLRHELKMRGIKHTQDGLKLSVATLRALRKYPNLMNILETAITKTKKLTKSFLNKPISIGRNVF